MWLQSETGDGQAVKEGIRVLGELISRKQTNSLSALTSVVEVKVETALVSDRADGKLNKLCNLTFTMSFLKMFILISAHNGGVEFFGCKL